MGGWISTSGNVRLTASDPLVIDPRQYRFYNTPASAVPKSIWITKPAYYSDESLYTPTQILICHLTLLHQDNPNPSPHPAYYTNKELSETMLTYSALAHVSQPTEEHNAISFTSKSKYYPVIYSCIFSLQRSSYGHLL